MQQTNCLINISENAKETNNNWQVVNIILIPISIIQLVYAGYVLYVNQKGPKLTFQRNLVFLQMISAVTLMALAILQLSLPGLQVLSQNGWHLGLKLAILYFSQVSYLSEYIVSFTYLRTMARYFYTGREVRRIPWVQWPFAAFYYTYMAVTLIVVTVYGKTEHPFQQMLIIFESSFNTQRFEFPAYLGRMVITL